jgi:hypothetical protein
MAPGEGKQPATTEKRARRPARPEPPIDIVGEPKPTPTERLESAKNEQIALLDEERRRLLKKVDKLQAMVDRLGPENARLREAHGYAVGNHILATVFVAIGGGSISFATFVEGVSKAVASGGGVLLLAGVSILVFGAFRGRGTKSSPPS